MLIDSESEEATIESRLSRLVEDAERNRFAIANCLAYLDSRAIDPKIRIALGLTESPVFENDLTTRLPTLFREKPGDRLLSLCSNSEGYLYYAFLRLGDNFKAPLYLLGCLIGKKYELVSAVCFKTTEFPNGSVFIKGVWYRPRGPVPNTYWQIGDSENLYEKLGSLIIKDSDSTEEEMLSIDLHPRYPKLVSTKQLIVARHCGGSWQAAREFSPSLQFQFTSEM